MTLGLQHVIQEWDNFVHLLLSSVDSNNSFIIYLTNIHQIKYWDQSSNSLTSFIFPCSGVVICVCSDTGEHIKQGRNIYVHILLSSVDSNNSFLSLNISLIYTKICMHWDHITNTLTSVFFSFFFFPRHVQ